MTSLNTPPISNANIMIYSFKKTNTVSKKSGFKKKSCLLQKKVNDKYAEIHRQSMVRLSRTVPNGDLSQLQDHELPQKLDEIENRGEYPVRSMMRLIRIRRIYE
jgi:hypothetical protein